MDTFLWLVVAHREPVFLFAFFLAAASLLLASWVSTSQRSERLRRSILVNAVALPPCLLVMAATLYVSPQGDSIEQVERVFVQHAPDHPALQRLSEIRQEGDWSELLMFRDQWSNPVHGYQLGVLSAAVKNSGLAFENEVLKQAETGVMRRSEFFWYSRMTIGAKSHDHPELASHMGESRLR